MPSVSLSAAEEAVDVPGLKSVRLLCKQAWEHHSPLPSRPFGQSHTDLAIHLSKGIGMRAIASSSLCCKFNTTFLALEDWWEKNSFELGEKITVSSSCTA